MLLKMSYAFMIKVKLKPLEWTFCNTAHVSNQQNQNVLSLALSSSNEKHIHLNKTKSSTVREVQYGI